MSHTVKSNDSCRCILHIIQLHNDSEVIEDYAQIKSRGRIQKRENNLHNKTFDMMRMSVLDGTMAILSQWYDIAFQYVWKRELESELLSPYHCAYRSSSWNHLEHVRRNSCCTTLWALWLRGFWRLAKCFDFIEKSYEKGRPTWSFEPI